MKFPHTIWWWNIEDSEKFLNSLLGCKIDLGKLKTIHKSLEMRHKRQFGKHFLGHIVHKPRHPNMECNNNKKYQKNDRENTKKNNHKFVNLVFMLLPQLNCANLANAQKYLHILFDSFTSRRLASYHSPFPFSSSFRPHAHSHSFGNTSMSILGICLIYEVDCPTDSQLAPRWSQSQSASVCLSVCLSVFLSACVRARFLQCICVCTLYRLFHITQVIIKILAGAAATAAASLINCGSGSLTTSFPCSTSSSCCYNNNNMCNLLLLLLLLWHVIHLRSWNLQLSRIRRQQRR